MVRATLALCTVACMLSMAAPPAHAASPPKTWDSLVEVKSSKLDGVYLLPGADFRGYTRVMLDPTEVAFRKNWQRDYNDGAASLGGRISDQDAQALIDRARTGFEDIFRKAYADAGYTPVDAAGDDVLRIRTAVVDLYVEAPDLQTAGRVRTFSREAGQATIIIEARDSRTGALLGRAVDRRYAGDTGPYLRNSVTTAQDYQLLFKSWAKASVDGLAKLKAASPIRAPAN